ncbi:hypothetical protein BJ982_000905 [Sphaerisporangium siamense]|uniref:Uncharacterized protein n=1 Tax=Sphaerisporangium siamense TaxID=795645 RepID=A0A7W7D3C0_9ACTN|nr:hypothetical protein [Sphaerisporangium siamense]
MCDHLGFNAMDLGERRRGEHLAGRAEGDHRAAHDA